MTKVDQPDFRHVLAASEGLLSCTDSKIVNSQDQCLETDEWPAPKNTTASNCVHIGPGTNSLDNKENKTIDNKTKAKIEPCRDDNRFPPHTAGCHNSLIAPKNNFNIREKNTEQSKYRLIKKSILRRIRSHSYCEKYCQLNIGFSVIKI